MIILRLLVPTVAALALSATASAAGPCTQQIAQVQAQIDAKLAANAATGPAAPESPGALLSRQPTPGSIAAAESKQAWGTFPRGDHSHRGRDGACARGRSRGQSERLRGGAR